MISENKLPYSLTKVIRVCCRHSIRSENFILKPVLIVPNKVLHVEYLLLTVPLKQHIRCKLSLDGVL